MSLSQLAQPYGEYDNLPLVQHALPRHDTLRTERVCGDGWGALVEDLKAEACPITVVMIVFKLKFKLDNIIEISDFVCGFLVYVAGRGLSDDMPW